MKGLDVSPGRLALDNFTRLPLIKHKNPTINIILVSGLWNRVSISLFWHLCSQRWGRNVL